MTNTGPDSVTAAQLEPTAFPKTKSSAPGNSTKRYLTGVQGLRTVAALLVAVYHIWFGRVSGGVDVFFVVAGYFAIGSLYRSLGAATNGREVLLRWRDYLLRTARRVIPSATVVITATIVLGYFLLPRSAQYSTLSHAWGAIGFYENWQLIAASADYAQQDDAASPFQQFWALGVNVQFYLLFSLIIALCAYVIVRKTGSAARLKRTVLLVVGLIFVASFIYSVYKTNADQAAAYFDTFARLWEFMAGAALFLLLTKEVLSKTLAKVVGWLGLLTLLLLGAFLDLSRLLPGYLSLLPVLAACAIIIASWSSADPAPLTWKPMLAVADASFALYLWHWPLLVFYRHHFGYDVSLLGGLSIIAVSLVLALATTKLIEDPLRKARWLVQSWKATLVVCALLLGLPSLLVVSWTAHLDRLNAEDAAALEDFIAEQQSGQDWQEGDPLNISGLVPHPSVAKPDGYAPVTDNGCVQGIKGEGVKRCDWGNLESETTVVVVGGSHSEQWIQPAHAAIESIDAHLTIFIKSSCRFGINPEEDFPLEPSCLDWNEEVLELILEEDPDLVITMGTFVRSGQESFPVSYGRAFEVLSNHGISVLAIRDNPASPKLAPTCLETEGIDECWVPIEEMYGPIEDLDLPEYPGLHVLDLVDLYCDEDACRATDGNITQYRDGNHLTATWIALNGGIVEEEILRILDERWQY